MTAYSRPNAVLCVVHETETAQVHLGSLDAPALATVSAELELKWDYSTLEQVIQGQ